MANRKTFTPKKREAFLAALSEGLTVCAACKRARIPRMNLYRWRQQDQAFQQDWDEALERGTDVVEEEARRRDTLRLFMLKALKPENGKRVSEGHDAGQFDALISQLYEVSARMAKEATGTHQQIA